MELQIIEGLKVTKCCDLSAFRGQQFVINNIKHKYPFDNVELYEGCILWVANEGAVEPPKPSAEIPEASLSDIKASYSVLSSRVRAFSEKPLMSHAAKQQRDLDVKLRAFPVTRIRFILPSQSILHLNLSSSSTHEDVWREFLAEFENLSPSGSFSFVVKPNTKLSLASKEPIYKNSLLFPSCSIIVRHSIK